MQSKIEKSRQANLEYLDRMHILYSDLQVLMLECLQVMDTNAKVNKSK